MFFFVSACSFCDNPEENKVTDDPVVENRDDSSLQKAYIKATKEINDSIKNKLLLDISYEAIPLKDSLFFLMVNKEARNLSYNLGDTLGVAASYWDMAQYYHRFGQIDSIYYYYDIAQKIYNRLGDKLSSGRLLLNMAIIQKNIKDYTGSEVATINAIDLLTPLNDYYSLYLAYNNLGIVFNEIEEYDKALEYHDKALKNLKDAKRTDKAYAVYNNIGVVYDNMSKYAEATSYFKKALKSTDSLWVVDPEVYAMALDNQAYSKLHLNDTAGVYQQFQTALSIREKQELNEGISISHLHLADYFLYKEDTVNAIKKALNAKAIATKNDNTRDLLLALKFLAKTAGDKAIDYSRQYIQINDSLNKNERAVRNKLARIRFETDQYISQTERLSQRVVWISTIAFVLFVIFILLYIIRNQWVKNKFIRLENRANQEIYDLLLTQQKEMERGQEKERHRISRELHDGILGRMFGVRLSLDSLNENDDEKSKEKRAKQITELQKIAQEIRLLSHELNKDFLIDTNFQVLLEELINRQPDPPDLQLDIEDSIDWSEIGNNIKINIYRILQEALNNIYKHAKATVAQVRIIKKERKIVLQVQDNGIGFSTQQVFEGIGLKNMKERSHAIKAQLSITSDSRGTLIEVVINL